MYKAALCVVEQTVHIVLFHVLQIFPLINAFCVLCTVKEIENETI